jgi:hypothetical protein
VATRAATAAATPSLSAAVPVRHRQSSLLIPTLIVAGLLLTAAASLAAVADSRVATHMVDPQLVRDACGGVAAAIAVGLLLALRL